MDEQEKGPKFKVGDKVVNPDKPVIISTVTRVHVIDRDEPTERYEYNVLYMRDGFPRVQNNVPEWMMALHQEKLL
jgi:hypothetical protein